MKSALVRSTLCFGALLASASLASAQNTDPRWKSMLGCWSSTEASGITLSGKTEVGLLCIVPQSTGSGVVIATLIDGEVVNRDNMDASGAQVAVTRDGCRGWESASWSRDNHRLLLRSEYQCPGGAVRKGSGVFGMAADSEMVQVQGIGADGNSGVRVRRFVPAAGVTVAFDTSTKAGASQAAIGFSTQTARLAAAAAMRNDDVLEMMKAVDSYVTEAWLTELGQTFSLNAKELVRLSNAGLPSRTMDLMIALSNPRVFVINKATPSDPKMAALTPRPGARVMPGVGALPFSCYDAFDQMLGFGYYAMGLVDPSCLTGLGARAFSNSIYGFNRFGYGYNGFNSGFNNGWYWGQTPVVIVNRGTTSDNSYFPAVPQGRAVNGGGYTRTSSGGGASSSGYSAPSSSSSSAGSSAGGGASGGGASGGGASGGGSTGRTAVPRPPGS